MVLHFEEGRRSGTKRVVLDGSGRPHGGPYAAYLSDLARDHIPVVDKHSSQLISVLIADNSGTDLDLSETCVSASATGEFVHALQ